MSDKLSKTMLGAIDIGSNAVRLRIDRVECGENGPVFKKAAFVRIPVRLGEDVFSTGRIGDEKQEQLCQAIAEFARLLAVYGVEHYRACATSAMREAANSEQIARTVRESCGIEVEVIGGELEADTVFAAGGMDAVVDRSKNYLYMDVGGGSTELVVFAASRKVAAYSFPLGTVRILGGGVREEEFRRFETCLSEIGRMYAPAVVIGSGGNIGKIHRLLGKRREEALEAEELRGMYDALAPLTVPQRMAAMRLSESRAETIVPALRIFLCAAEACGAGAILVPGVGLADGIIRRLYESLL